MRQPSVSARVQDLERHLGVQLFDRSGRNARCTPKGRELLTFADQMLRLTGEVEQRIGSRAALVGRVRFGVTSTPAVTWMPRLARAFPGIEPCARVVIDIGQRLPGLRASAVWRPPPRSN
jgi:DNA-binding transcriptional LysR family regulator